MWLENAVDRVPGSLLDAEKLWRDRYEFLKSNGYLLRPRYRPGWAPPPQDDFRKSKDLPEELIEPKRAGFLDATRLSDALPVFLKVAPQTSPEIEIATYFSSPDLLQDPRNHCAPVLDILPDPLDTGRVIIVTGLLRGINAPSPGSVREYVDFASQLLEGMVFMHEHHVAHLDIVAGNIMMDGRPMFPQGWHPQESGKLLDGTWMSIEGVTPLSRSAVGGVRYYYIDFNIASKDRDVIVGLAATDPAPELSGVKPYNPYKTDVWLLGRLFQSFAIEPHPELEFFRPLASKMVSESPADRPTAQEALDQFEIIKGSLGAFQLSQRLPTLDVLGKPVRNEGDVSRFVNDWLYRLQDAWWNLQSTGTAIQPPGPR